MAQVVTVNLTGTASSRLWRTTQSPARLCPRARRVLEPHNSGDRADETANSAVPPLIAHTLLPAEFL